MNANTTAASRRVTAPADSHPLSVLARESGIDILTDETSRRLYATDASHYEQLPGGVVLPADAQACEALVRAAASQETALIARGGGTGLCGQTVGAGVVVDCSRHMNRVLDIDVDNRIARVQPGVIPAELNAMLRTDGLRFGPDPSTLDRCTIGGMHGNNAWGSHAPRDGTTRDNVQAANGLLGDGTAVYFKPLDEDELRQKLNLNDAEGRVYRKVFEVIDRNRELILERSPASGVTNNTGYALDVLARGQPWVAEGEPFNLTRLLSGSEGTLALLTSLDAGLLPVPTARSLLCVHFSELTDAVSAVPELMQFQPAAMEMLDRALLTLARSQPSQSSNRFWLQGDPDAVLMIEFSGEPNDVEQRSRACHELALTLTGQYAATPIDSDRIDDVFAMRRSALGLLMGRPGKQKTATVIEDSAVPVDALPEYVADVRALMKRMDVECLYYGSLSRGLVHLRPWLDLEDPQDLQKFVELPDAMQQLVARYRGAFSTKHGDGRLRAPWLEKIYGKEIVALFREVKSAFDPVGILNPGKILDAPPMNAPLRAPAPQRELPGGFNWPDADWSRHIAKCNGAGACRKSGGLMCPSYKATRDEKYSTRGRANLLRQLTHGESVVDQEVGDALALCLSCKGCRLECPANVDMARLKAEWLFRHAPRSLSSALISRFSGLSQLATKAPSISNWLLSRGIAKRLLGVDERRALPRLARQRFSQWFATHHQSQDADVILINDPHSEFYEPEIGIAAVQVLNRLGFRAHLTDCVSSGRVEISQGRLDRARSAVTKLVQTIERTQPANDVSIIGLEPSELLTLRDEAGDLFQGAAMSETVASLAKRSLLFDEFLLGQSLPESNTVKSALVHTHCHQKALANADSTRDVLTRLGWKVQQPTVSCCGMAGFFGYQHYDVSQKIGEMGIVSHARDADSKAIIVANGTSCRHQIRDGSGRSVLHVAEAVALALGVSTSSP